MSIFHTTRSDATSSPQGSRLPLRRVLAAGAMAAALFATGCSVSSGGATGPGLPGGSTSSGGTNGKATKVTGIGTLSLPRTITYGVLDVTVTGARLLPTHPFDANQDDPERDYLGLDVTIDNPLNSSYGTFSGDAGIFRVTYDDHEEDPGFLEDGQWTVDAHDDSVEHLWFAVEPDKDFSNLALVVATTHAEPAVLPLSSAPAAPERVDLSVEQASFQAADLQVGVSLKPGAYADLNIAVDEDGVPGAGWHFSLVDGLGRALAGTALVHLPATAEGKPVQPVALTFNGINYGIPTLATADGANADVYTNFPGLDARFQGEFVIKVPDALSELTFRIGCPCGGLLTGSTIDDVRLSVVVDASGTAALFGQA